MDYKIKSLFLKYIANQCSPRELDEVFALIRSGIHQAEWEAALSDDAEAVLAGDSESNLTATETDRIYQGIDGRLFPSEENNAVFLPGRKFRVWPAAAAAIILIVAVSAYVFFKPMNSGSPAQVHLGDVRPGGNKAFLTLSNGKRISLTDAAQGNIAAQEGIKITKTADGKIIYAAENVAEEKGLASYNTIETPKGGQYQVLLPDGTSVWLNAASSLTYPVNFRGSRERRVQLQGEAYFEVARDKKHPFVVKTDRQEVTVLGTHFNINGYKEEPVISTTLLEGSIQTRNLTSGQAVVLSPGQQSTLIKGGKSLDVARVNTENIISWKNGYFMSSLQCTHE